MNDIYDQTLQVQKRAFLQKLLESVTARLLEIKRNLHEIELSDIIYIDHTLISNKLTPQETQLLRSYYFLYNRPEEIQNIINEYHRNKVNRENKDQEQKCTILDCRNKAIEFTDSIEQNNLTEQEPDADIKIVVTKPSGEVIQAENLAAQIIQKYWFRYKHRKSNLKRQLDGPYLLGLAEDYNINKNAIEAINKGKELKRSKKLEFNHTFQAACEQEKENILKKSAENIKFDISDYIRNWFKEM